MTGQNRSNYIPPPEKAVVAPFARASLADTGREAKRAGGCYKKIFWEGLKGQKGSREIRSLPVEVSLPLGCRRAVFGRGGSFGGRGWKLNKARCLVRGWWYLLFSLPGATQ